MTINLNTDDILNKVKLLSEYEGRDARDANGVSIFDKVLVTEQDEDLVRPYITQGIDSLESALGSLLDDSSKSADGKTVILELKGNTPTAKKATEITTTMEEVVTAHVMFNWFSERKPDRVEFYKLLIETMTNTAIRLVAQRKKPILC